MAYLVEFPVEGGGRLLVQAGDEDLPGGLELAAVRPGEIAAHASETVEHALDQIKPALESVVERLRALSPDEVTVEFGVVLNAEIGAVVAKGGAEAHFNVGLTWRPGGNGAAGETASG
jgi:Trypsin-co-occurring domain 1